MPPSVFPPHESCFLPIWTEKIFVPRGPRRRANKFQSYLHPPGSKASAESKVVHLPARRQVSVDRQPQGQFRAIKNDEHITQTQLHYTSPDGNMASTPTIKTSYEEEIVRRRQSPHPLSSIFEHWLIDHTQGATIFAIPRNIKYDRMHRGLDEQSWFIHPLEKGAFFLNFRQYPIDFLRAEHAREARCNELGIKYIPPQLTDSVQVTLERISVLDTAIDKANEAAAERSRRKAMTKEDRKVASAKKAEYRRKIKMNESEEEAIKRRARQTKERKGQMDRKYNKNCERKKLPRPAPREDGDTAAEGEKIILQASIL